MLSSCRYLRNLHHSQLKQFYSLKKLFVVFLNHAYIDCERSLSLDVHPKLWLVFEELVIDIVDVVMDKV